jgi:hypothetical protein
MKAIKYDHKKGFKRLALKAFFMVFMLAPPFSASPCDFCTFYTGVIPNERQNKIEIWNRYRALGGYLGDVGAIGARNSAPFFKTSHGDHNANPLLPPVYNPRDKIWLNTTEIRFSCFLHPRIALLLNAPFVYNLTRINGAAATYTGLSDPLLLAHYFPLWKEKASFSFRVGLGAGIKAPLGKYANLKDGSIVQHIYPGSGSWDPIFSFQQFGRYKRWGFFSLVTYRLATANPLGYKYGNSSNVQLNFFHNFEVKSQKQRKHNFLPSLGCYYERNEDDKFGEKTLATKLESLFLTVGIDYFFSKLSFSAAYQYPFFQKSNSPQLGNGGRLNIGIQYNFSGRPFIQPKNASNNE